MEKLKEAVAKARAELAPLESNTTKSPEHKAILALCDGLESKSAEKPAGNKSSHSK